MIRFRLRAKGLQFSDIPTEEEIESIRIESEKARDLEGIDTSLIIEGNSRKRSNPSQDGDEVLIKKPSAPPAPIKFDNLEDEEAEADL